MQSQATILVVEDEPLARELLVDALKESILRKARICWVHRLLIC